MNCIGYFPLDSPLCDVFRAAGAGDWDPRYRGYWLRVSDYPTLRNWYVSQGKHMPQELVNKIFPAGEEGYEMKKLIKYRPMCAVLRRSGIGSEDGYGRGYWLRASDLPRLREWYAAHGTKYGDDLYVNGTNIHNQVMLSEFEELFREVVVGK